MEVFALQYVNVCRTIKSVPWSIRTKTVQGKYIQYYKQERKNGCLVQTYIGKADVPSLLKEYEKKKANKALKKEMDRQLAMMTKRKRHDVRCQIRFFMLLNEDELRIRKQIHGDDHDTYVAMDGTLLDSKSEVVCYNVALAAGLKPTHNYRIYPYPGSSLYHKVDLTFSVSYDSDGIPVSDPNQGIRTEQFFHEHFGLLRNPSYFQKQISKLQDYRSFGIQCGHNLILTSSDVGISEPQILKRLVIGNAISGETALRLYKKVRKQKQTLEGNG